MAPPIVSMLALVVTVWFAVNVTAPVPRFRLLLPTKVKLAPQLSALLLLSVMAAPLVLSIVPPLTVNVPEPTAVALLMINSPADSVVPPENVLLPVSVSVPLPAFVTL